MGIGLSPERGQCVGSPRKKEVVELVIPYCPPSVICIGENLTEGTS